MVTKSLSRDEIARLQGGASAPASHAAPVGTVVPASAAPTKPAPAVTSSPAGKKLEQIVPLTCTVEYDGKVYDQLVVRRLRGGDFRKLAELSEAGEDIAIAALMTGVPVEVIEALDGDDYVEIQGLVRDFLPRKLQMLAEQLSATGQNTQQ